jgi:hypothetical protein
MSKSNYLLIENNKYQNEATGLKVDHNNLNPSGLLRIQADEGIHLLSDLHMRSRSAYIPHGPADTVGLSQPDIKRGKQKNSGQY